jgi:hypothetical protein
LTFISVQTNAVKREPTAIENIIENKTLINYDPAKLITSPKNIKPSPIIKASL